jgi:hypothetical protein
MATALLLLEREREKATSLPVVILEYERGGQLLSHSSSSLKDGDGHLHTSSSSTWGERARQGLPPPSSSYSSLGDGAMTTSLLLIVILP